MKFVFIMPLILCACSTSIPREVKIGEKTFMQMDKKLIGMTVMTSTTEIEKPTTQKEKTQQRQSAAAFWFGAILLGFAPVCVLIGYICSGWKFWGILAALCGLLGAGFWSFESLIPLLKWPAYGIFGAIVLWSMWKLKDFSLFNLRKNSKKNIDTEEPPYTFTTTSN